MSDAGKESACINPFCDRQGTLILTVFDREVGYACRTCVETFSPPMLPPIVATVDAAKLEAIVRALAACDPMSTGTVAMPDHDYAFCELCETDNGHAESCPWRLAQELIEDSK